MERRPRKISQQIKRSAKTPVKKKKEYDGDIGSIISTGSTLLDLAISGGRIRGGGIPAKILVEIFGQSGTGKTILLCEIAGDVQRKQGEIIFNDPEARLNKQFARMFDLNTKEIAYSTPNTVTEVFEQIRKWQPKSKGINTIVADSLAALSTEMEMEKDEGDKMGMRRAKEFSEELRKSCRILSKNNFLMVCSNQVRVNQNAGPYGQKYRSPGGEAVGFYSSLRLRAKSASRINSETKVSGRKIKRPIGVEVDFEVFKSSVWKPFRTAPVSIIFDYGVDDIRENLKFVKRYTGGTVYCVNDRELDNSLEKAIRIVEEEELETELKEQVIDLWEEIENKFQSNRKKKKR